MHDTYVALGTAATVAPVIVTIVYQLRALFPRQLSADRIPPVAIAVGAALLIGLAGGVKAMGLWSATKAMTEGRTAAAEPPAPATEMR